jgi:hypothetical protein
MVEIIFMLNGVHLQHGQFMTGHVVIGMILDLLGLDSLPLQQVTDHNQERLIMA